MEKSSSADFSFLMSVPIIIASLLYEVVTNREIVTVGVGSIVIAFISAFVSGIAAIRFMLNIVRKVSLHWFSIYLFVLGVSLLFFLY
jgi:undecaprenyl-diphosphatase